MIIDLHADHRLIDFFQKIESPATKMTQSLDPFHINTLIEYVSFLEEAAQPGEHNNFILLCIYSYLAFWGGNFYGSALFIKGALNIAPDEQKFDCIAFYKKSLNLFAQYDAFSLSMKIKAQKKSLALKNNISNTKALSDEQMQILDLLDLEFCARIDLQENTKILTENFIERWKNSNKETLIKSFEYISFPNAPLYWKEHHLCPRLNNVMNNLKYVLIQ